MTLQQPTAPPATTPKKLSPFIQRLVRQGNRSRTMYIANLLDGFVRPGDSVLDVGSGTCLVSEWLLEQGHAVTALDVRNLSCSERVSPVIYDGGRFPFDEGAFQTAIIAYVLHHVRDPIAVLREAVRVAPRVVVMEDLVKGTLQRYFTYAWDSLLNLEFFGHPHTNRSDEGWKREFADLGLELLGAKYSRLLGLSHAAYLVART